MKEYEEFLERYCESKNVTREEAERHALVHYIKKYYEGLEDEKGCGFPD